MIWIRELPGAKYISNGHKSVTYVGCNVSTPAQCVCLSQQLRIDRYICTFIEHLTRIFGYVTYASFSMFLK